ncbi:MAG: YebC/PmpR family DNA-binding transcriptional regulator [Fimbriiglobus sp.]
MAGHSHSANIAVRKGKQDAARAKLFSKLARYIMIASKNGGPDPTTNLRLRYAIDKARSVSMPKDNIERAVKKGTGDLEGVIYEEISYEGYGPGGVAILVETLTEKRTRTNGEVRLCFDKLGGNMGAIGSVGYLFVRKGLFLIEVKLFPDEDAVMSAALEADAEDCKREGDFYELTCDATKFAAVSEALQAAGFTFEVAELRQLASTPVDVDVETGKKVMRLIAALEDNDDVQNVYTNANITDEMADG